MRLYTAFEIKVAGGRLASSAQPFRPLPNPRRDEGNTFWILTPERSQE
jgi:hypothetical protein